MNRTEPWQAFLQPADGLNGVFGQTLTIGIERFITFPDRICDMSWTQEELLRLLDTIQEGAYLL